jgi:hypothetical protein
MSLDKKRMGEHSHRILSPASTRKHSLSDGWDMVRAAQHMLEVHGKQAFSIAERRAGDANEPVFVKRWRDIATTIREIEQKTGQGSSEIAPFAPIDGTG